ncbi:hypothetical protein ACLKA7_000216 [Drosophila subpalustris]
MGATTVRWAIALSTDLKLDFLHSLLPAAVKPNTPLGIVGGADEGERTLVGGVLIIFFEEANALSPVSAPVLITAPAARSGTARAAFAWLASL